MKTTKRFKGHVSGNADSIIVLGDLTAVNQITRVGKVVTLQGREDPRSFTLPDENVAASFWQALASEAAEAVREDRQFFCVSFGAGNSEYEDYLPGHNSVH